jgi:hypothetical protein
VVSLPPAVPTNNLYTILFIPIRATCPAYLIMLAFLYCVRFEVIRTVTMKNAVFGDVTPCGSCQNWRFGGTYRLHHQSDKIRELGTLAVTSNRSTLRGRSISWQRASVASALILIILMLQAIHFYDTSALTRGTRRNISFSFIFIDKIWESSLQNPRVMSVGS